MKKALKSLICAVGLAFVGVSGWADTNTPRTGLILQSFGDQNWDIGLRNNFSIIDASMCVQAGANTFTGTNIFTGGNAPGFYNGALFYSTGGGFTGISAAASGVTDTFFTLPPIDGSAGQLIQTDGSGHWSFVSGSAGTLLSSNNTWTGANNFSQALTASGGIVANGNSSTTGSMTANSFVLSGTGGGLQTISGATGLVDTAHAIFLQSNPGGIVEIVNGSTLAFAGPSGYTGLKGASSYSGNVILTLPNTYGTAGQAIITDGAGNLSFQTPGSAILNQNTLQTGSTFYVSSGTVAGNLTATNVFLPGISNGQCLQSGPGGQIFGTGFSCASSVGIQNRDTLQAGATFFVTSGTISGNFYVVNGNNSGLYMSPSNGATNPIIGSTGNLEFDAGSTKQMTMYNGPVNGVPGPSAQFIGNISLQGSGDALYFKQTTGTPGDNFISFIASQAVTTTQFVLPNADGTSGQAIITDGNHNLSFGTVAGSGGGGYAVQPATVAFNLAQGVTGSTFTFTGPSPSTVTYGLAVGSLTVAGTPGVAGSWSAIEGTTPSGLAGYITLTADTTGPALKEIVNGGATYYVATSSVAANTNDVVGWGPGGNGQLVDIGPYPTGAPGGPTGSLQLNAGGGLFTGSPAYVWSGSSLTIISSVSVTNVGGRTNLAPDTGYFDVFHSTAFAGQFLFTVGSENNSHQFYVADQQPVNMGTYGSIAGALNVGNNLVSRVLISNSLISSTAQKIDLGSAAGVMQLETASVGSGGGDIVLMPETSTAARFNSAGAVFTTSVTVTAPATAAYDMTISSSNSVYHVAISTTGHFISNGPTPSISSCGSTPNGSVVGDDTTGTITIGGGSVTGCTLTFFRTFGTGCTVNCVISDNITTATPDVTSSISGMTLGFSASIGGGSVTYVCTGYGPTCQ